jgi:predicted PurR-regulated permease PerM
MFSLPDQDGPSQQSTIATHVWTRRLIIILTILASLVLVVLLLNGASHITTSILIFLVAALIAYAIVPLVDLLHRVMPRALAILAVYLVVLVLLGLLMYFVIYTTVIQIIQLEHTIGGYLTPGSNGKPSPIVQFLLALGLSSAQLSTITQQLEAQLTGFAGTVAGGVLPILSSITSALVNILLTVVISIYLLIDGSGAIRWLRYQTPKSQRGRINSLLDAMQHVVGGYVRGQFTLCLIIGFIVGAGLAILHMHYAVLLGVLSFVTEFIPVLGTIFTGVVSVLLALTQGWLEALLVLAFFILVHVFEGYILSPRLVGKSVGLNPAVSLLALIIGAELFGPWGAIFAAPTAGLIQAIAVAFWTNYRSTHRDEFPAEEKVPASKSAEELAASLAQPTDDAPVKEE